MYTCIRTYMYMYIMYLEVTIITRTYLQLHFSGFGILYTFLVLNFAIYFQKCDIHFFLQVLNCANQQKYQTVHVHMYVSTCKCTCTCTYLYAHAHVHQILGGHTHSVCTQHHLHYLIYMNIHVHV